MHFIESGIPFIIAISYCLLAIQPDLRLATPTLLGVTATVTMLLSATLYLGEKGMVRWSPWTILTMAAMLRLIFLFRSPELSDDLYRYLWDGLQTLAGHNPYSLAPSNAPAHSEAMARLVVHVNHPEMITIYPPAAQLIFAAGAALGGGILELKALLMGMDLVTCYLLIQLLKTLNLPPWRSVLYAWHPLAVLEITASGHIDGAGLLFFFASIFLILARSSDGPCVAPGKGFFRIRPHRSILPLASGLAFACAALVKLLPLIFLPGCLICLPKRAGILFLLGFAAGAALLSVCFLPDLVKGLGTLGVYARHWEFSGFLFKSLHSGALTGDMVRGCLASLLLFSMVYLYKALGSDKTRLEKTTDPGEHSSGQVPGIPCEEASVQVLSRAVPVFYSVTLAFLLLAPTLYPWYALLLVGMIPFAAGPTGLVFSWSVFLSYQVLIPYTLFGLWVEGAWTPALIWLAPVGAFLLSVLAGRPATRKAL